MNQKRVKSGWVPPKIRKGNNSDGVMRLPNPNFLTANAELVGEQAGMLMVANINLMAALRKYKGHPWHAARPSSRRASLCGGLEICLMKWREL